MIVLVVDINRVLAFESESNAPVAADIHRPTATPIAFQRMKSESRKTMSLGTAATLSIANINVRRSA